MAHKNYRKEYYFHIYIIVPYIALNSIKCTSALRAVLLKVLLFSVYDNYFGKMV